MNPSGDSKSGALIVRVKRKRVEEAPNSLVIVQESFENYGNNRHREKSLSSNFASLSTAGNDTNNFPKAKKLLLERVNTIDRQIVQFTGDLSMSKGLNADGKSEASDNYLPDIDAETISLLIEHRQNSFKSTLTDAQTSGENISAKEEGSCSKSRPLLEKYENVSEQTEIVWTTSGKKTLRGSKENEKFVVVDILRESIAKRRQIDEQSNSLLTFGPGTMDTSGVMISSNPNIAKAVRIVNPITRTVFAPSILKAFRCNNFDDMALALRDSVDLNYRCPEENCITALMVAAMHANSRMTQRLIALGADPNIADGYAKRALDYAREAQCRYYEESNNSKGLLAAKVARELESAMLKSQSPVNSLFSSRKGGRRGTAKGGNNAINEDAEIDSDGAADDDYVIDLYCVPATYFASVADGIEDILAVASDGTPGMTSSGSAGDCVISPSVPIVSIPGLHLGQNGSVELFEEDDDWADQADDEEIDSNDERFDGNDYPDEEGSADDINGGLYEDLDDYHDRSNSFDSDSDCDKYNKDTPFYTTKYKKSIQKKTRTNGNVPIDHEKSVRFGGDCGGVDDNEDDDDDDDGDNDRKEDNYEATDDNSDDDDDNVDVYHPSSRRSSGAPKFHTRQPERQNSKSIMRPHLIDYEDPFMRPTKDSLQVLWGGRTDGLSENIKISSDRIRGHGTVLMGTALSQQSHFGMTNDVIIASGSSETNIEDSSYVSTNDLLTNETHNVKWNTPSMKPSWIFSENLGEIERDREVETTTAHQNRLSQMAERSGFDFASVPTEFDRYGMPKYGCELSDSDYDVDISDAPTGYSMEAYDSEIDKEDSSIGECSDRLDCDEMEDGNL